VNKQKGDHHHPNADTSTRGMSSSARSASLLRVGSPEASAAEHDGEDNGNTPRHVGYGRHVIGLITQQQVIKQQLQG
jgi:hypothetical protein